MDKATIAVMLIPALIILALAVFSTYDTPKTMMLYNERE